MLTADVRRTTKETEKYANDTAARAKLEQRIKNGGSGAWGTVPMPPNNVPDGDLKTLVGWILSQK